MEKTVLHNLNSGMVLDRSVLVTLQINDVSQTIASIRAAGPKYLCVVDSAEQFFTPATLMALLAAKDKRYLLVNEALGGFFTEQQLALIGALPGVIKPAAVAEADLIVNLAAPEPGAYTFAKVPEGWSISGNISLGDTRIKRKVNNSDGDGTLFFMSPQDFEKLWIFASECWCAIANGNWAGGEPTKFFLTGQGKLKATVQDDRISLGGNYIRRYEIEQIAKYRNWAMPQQVAVAA